MPARSLLGRFSWPLWHPKLSEAVQGSTLLTCLWSVSRRRSGSFLGGLVTATSLFAFAAGLASAVNPCGFAMLPALPGPLPRLRRSRRRVRYSAAVNTGPASWVGRNRGLHCTVRPGRYCYWVRRILCGQLHTLDWAYYWSAADSGGRLACGRGKAVHRHRGAGRFPNRRPGTGQCQGILPFRHKLRHSVVKLHPSHLFGGPGSIGSGILASSTPS